MRPEEDKNVDSLEAVRIRDTLMLDGCRNLWHYVE